MGRQEKQVDFDEVLKLYTGGMSVERICKKIGLSKPQLGLRCKRLFGSTPEAWLKAQASKPAIEVVDKAASQKIVDTAASLATIQCTVEQICAKLCITQAALQRAVEATGDKFDQWFASKKNQGLVELKFWLWQAAKNGDMTTLRALAREYLSFGLNDNGMHESVTQVVISGIDGEQVIVDPSQFGPSEDES